MLFNKYKNTSIQLSMFMSLCRSMPNPILTNAAQSSYNSELNNGSGVVLSSCIAVTHREELTGCR